MLGADEVVGPTREGVLRADPEPRASSFRPAGYMRGDGRSGRAYLEGVLRADPEPFASSFRPGVCGVKVVPAGRIGREFCGLTPSLSPVRFGRAYAGRQSFRPGVCREGALRADPEPFASSFRPGVCGAAVVLAGRMPEESACHRTATACAHGWRQTAFASRPGRCRVPFQVAANVGGQVWPGASPCRDRFPLPWFYSSPWQRRVSRPRTASWGPGVARAWAATATAAKT